MKIEFKNLIQTVEANEIIRCKFNGKGVFHISYDKSLQIIDVYAPTDALTCYEIDNKKIKDNKENG